MAVKPTQPSLESGTSATVQLELTDNQDHPTTGQLRMMVVNEAVLQLSGYRPPNLVDTVYSQQPIATRFSDNRPDVVIEQPTVNIPKCWGYSGGLSKGAANTRIRKNFQALAYYNASMITDTKGQASVTFKLPDDLTKQRVMVVGTNGNLRFGNGEGTFMTTKLITNAILPQFAQPGDRLIGVLSITNNTGSTGELIDIS